MRLLLTSIILFATISLSAQQIADCIKILQLEIITLDSKAGELKLKKGSDSSWIDFNFRVVKENGKWKIAYMQGFDLKEGTREG